MECIKWGNERQNKNNRNRGTVRERKSADDYEQCINSILSLLSLKVYAKQKWINNLGYRINSWIDEFMKNCNHEHIVIDRQTENNRMKNSKKKTNIYICLAVAMVSALLYWKTLFTSNQKYKRNTLQLNFSIFVFRFLLSIFSLSFCHWLFALTVYLGIFFLHWEISTHYLSIFV